MDLFNDLTKGDGCGPQQGALGGLAGQLLRMQQQGGGGGGGGAAAHMGAPTAQWRQNIHESMHGPQMGGAGPMDARFHSGPPPIMRAMSAPVPPEHMMAPPSQSRSMSMPGSWGEEFHHQQQQQAMISPQQQMQHEFMQRQQHMMMMQQRQQMMMMMMPPPMMQMPGMMGAMGPLMHYVPPPQMPAEQQYASPQLAAAVEQQEEPQLPQQLPQEEAAGAEESATAAAAARDPALETDAYRRMQEAWASVQRGEGPIDPLWEEMMAMNGLDQEAAGGAAASLPARPPYRFTPENKFLSPDAKAQTAFDEGVRLFRAGLINDALLAFEAVVQLEDDHAEAWRMLGQCHADHDEDQKAIVCLERSAECDAYNLPTLLTLGVCYVNELDHERALSNLKAWVEHNPDFIGLEVKKDPYSDGSLVDEVMNLMLQVQEHDPRNADVQEVLGVVCVVMMGSYCGQ